MKPSSYIPVSVGAAGDDIPPTTSHQRGASAADTTTVSTLTLSKNTSAIYISVETTNARVTFDGSNPGAASAPSTVFPKDSVPVLIPIGAGATVKWVSTAAAASVVQIFELR